MSLIVPPSPANIERAAFSLREGQLIGLPTETVYGLGADATNAAAISAVYEAKGRPRFNPLISHVASLDAAQEFGVFSAMAIRLAEAFWPGPLTLVVPKSARCTVVDLVTCGLETIALRVPNHGVAQAVLLAFGGPVAAPSANTSGRPSPTLAAHVSDELGMAVSMVLDGGACLIGLESTVLSVSGERVTLLRSGGISRAEVEAHCGLLSVPDGSNDTAPPSPGMLARHYAPKTPMHINVADPPAGAAHIGFGVPRPRDLFNFSPSGDLKEAAANLFTMLRLADALGAPLITIAPIPNFGLGEAINDRLRRGAAG